MKWCPFHVVPRLFLHSSDRNRKPSEHHLRIQRQAARCGGHFLPHGDCERIEQPVRGVPQQRLSDQSGRCAIETRKYNYLERSHRLRSFHERLPERHGAHAFRGRSESRQFRQTRCHRGNQRDLRGVAEAAANRSQLVVLAFRFHVVRFRTST